MAGVIARRTLTSLVATVAIAVFLSACFLLPSRNQESGNDMTGSIDTKSLGDAITGSSSSIESTYIAVKQDGMGHTLYVLPTLTSDSLTSAELSDVLRIAYNSTIGEVETIEVETEDVTGNPLDVASAARELGVQNSELVNSVTYSTVYLAEAYGE